jgi:hypothetical protein
MKCKSIRESFFYEVKGKREIEPEGLWLRSARIAGGEKPGSETEFSPKAEDS